MAPVRFRHRTALPERRDLSASQPEALTDAADRTAPVIHYDISSPPAKRKTMRPNDGMALNRTLQTKTLALLDNLSDVQGLHDGILRCTLHKHQDIRFRTAATHEATPAEGEPECDQSCKTLNHRRHREISSSAAFNLRFARSVLSGRRARGKSSA